MKTSRSISGRQVAMALAGAVILAAAIFSFSKVKIGPFASGGLRANAANGAGRIEYKSFHSASLGEDIACAVSLPPSYDSSPARRYPTVIFLHGLFNNERDWERRGGQARVDELRAAGKVGEFIVALPYGGNSFFINSKNGKRYEDAIVTDFIGFIDGSYRTMAAPRARVIEGISMGGYGALFIAFKHPELFTAVAAHSAALFEELPSPPSSGTDLRSTYRYQIASEIFGSPPDPRFFQQNNPLYLAKMNASKIKKLKIYFDVGSDDRYGFEAGNEKLDQLLTSEGVKHEFHLAPGGHGWPFLMSRSEPDFVWVWTALSH